MKKNNQQVSIRKSMVSTYIITICCICVLSGLAMIAYYACYAGMIGLQVLFIVLGISMATKLYYRFKLQTPFAELKKGIANIQENNLDFTITYNEKNELGGLCSSMEKMRGELCRNQKELWELLEQRKLLNAYSRPEDTHNGAERLSGLSLQEYTAGEADRGRHDPDSPVHAGSRRTPGTLCRLCP